MSNKWRSGLSDLWIESEWRERSLGSSDTEGDGEGDRLRFWEVLTVWGAKVLGSPVLRNWMTSSSLSSSAASSSLRVSSSRLCSARRSAKMTRASAALPSSRHINKSATRRRARALCEGPASLIASSSFSTSAISAGEASRRERSKGMVCLVIKKVAT